MDRTAAVGEERGGIKAARIRSVDSNRAGIFHIDLTALADCTNTNDSIFSCRFNCHFLAVEIDIERLCGIDVRDGGSVLDCPWSAYHLVRIIRTNYGILGKHIVPVALANAGIRVRSIMRFVTRDGCGELRIRLGGRRIGGRRIDIAALSARPIECDILDTLTGGRGRQALGDLRLAREISLSRRIGGVPELVGERIERRTDEVLVRRRCRFRIETCAVRRQRNGAARRCVLDTEVAALDRRWRCSIMLVEYTCMAAVIINRDVLVVFLEDHARIVGIVAAP